VYLNDGLSLSVAEDIEEIYFDLYWNDRSVWEKFTNWIRDKWVNNWFFRRERKKKYEKIKQESENKLSEVNGTNQ